MFLVLKQVDEDELRLLFGIEHISNARFSSVSPSADGLHPLLSLTSLAARYAVAHNMLLAHARAPRRAMDAPPLQVKMQHHQPAWVE